jgi:hypothetical protein
MIAMHREGPPIESLTRRLAECPPEFLASPRLGAVGKVVVPAVVADLLREMGSGPLPDGHAAAFNDKARWRQRNTLSLTLVACWLLHDPWFRRRELADRALTLLAGGLHDLAQATSADRCVTDADRREELARLCLKALGLRPAGETVAQAEDRLATLSSLERASLLKATAAAEQRAAEIRAAMARKAQEEANLKAMRE